MPIVSTESRMSEVSGSTTPSIRSSFWQRHNTIINFWLDLVLLILFLAQAWIVGVLHLIFPRGAGPEWKVWGASSVHWSDLFFNIFCAFSAAVILHVMLHWNWICGVIITRVLKRRMKQDDGSRTLIGVGLLVVVFHAIAAGLLLARVGLTGPA
jgi:hypothetical protein